MDKSYKEVMEIAMQAVQSIHDIDITLEGPESDITQQSINIDLYGSEVPFDCKSLKFFIKKFSIRDREERGYTYATTEANAIKLLQNSELTNAKKEDFIKDMYSKDFMLIIKNLLTKHIEAQEKQIEFLDEKTQEKIRKEAENINKFLAEWF